MIGRKKLVLACSLCFLAGAAGSSRLIAQSAAEQPAWQEVNVDGHCQTQNPDTGELQKNPDVCQLERRGVYRSRHIAAKEVDGAVQHALVRITEQTYLLQNIHSEPVVFVVSQEVPEGWHVDSDPQPKEMKDNVAVFRVTAQPGQIVRLHVGMAQETPLENGQ